MKAYELHPDEGFAALRAVERARAPARPARRPRARARASRSTTATCACWRGRAKRKAPVVPGLGRRGRGGRRSAPGSRASPSAIAWPPAFFPTWLAGRPPGGAPPERARRLASTACWPRRSCCAETAWVKLPAYLAFEQAATLPCAGVTAWHALFEAAALRPATRCSSRAPAACRSSRCSSRAAAGAHVVATSSSAEKRARLERMGRRDDRLPREPEVGRRRARGDGRPRRRRRGRGGRRGHVRPERAGAALRRDHEPARHPGRHAGPDRHLRGVPQEPARARRLRGLGRDVRGPAARARRVEARAGRSTACSGSPRCGPPTSTCRAARTSGRS